MVISLDDGLLRINIGFNGWFPSITLYCDWLKVTVATVKWTHNYETRWSVLSCETE